MRLELRKPFAELWQHCDAFQAAFALGGEEYRHVKNRRTFRIELEGRGFFVKLHSGIGWSEIFKNLLQFKLPVTGADNEYDALIKLSSLGVRTMTPVAFGSRGDNPAVKESFLITEELTGSISLEDLAAHPVPGDVKRRLIAALGKMLGAMHRAGINHRDCYICHFLLKKNTMNSAQPQLHVIDLHRAQIRSQVPWHYLVKDVAGIYFSAMDVPLSPRDLCRFIHFYSGGNLKYELTVNRHFWQQTASTATALYRKIHRKEGKV